MKKYVDQVFLVDECLIKVSRFLGGAQKCAAHSLHRLTHERPASTTNRDSRRSVGVATAARDRVNVTWVLHADRLTTSLRALGLDCTEAASSRRREPHGHPALAMGTQA
jgi:hypothetical protein